MKIYMKRLKLQMVSASTDILLSKKIITIYLEVIFKSLIVYIKKYAVYATGLSKYYLRFTGCLFKYNKET